MSRLEEAPAPADDGHATGGDVPTHDYVAFCMRWRSQVPLPLPASGQAEPVDEADMTLRLAEVPRRLHRPAAERHIDTPQRKALWQAAAGEFLMHVDRIGSIYINDARTVLAQPSGSLERFGRFMYRVLSTVVLQQCGMTPFHASASATEGGALVFLGASGAGKSTLAATLAAHRMPLMADDLTAVRVASSGSVEAWPAFPGVRLWGEAVERLGSHQAPEPLVRGGKLYVPCMAHPTPLPIRAVYLLATSGSTAGPARRDFDIERVPSLEAYRLLHRNILRFNYAAGLGCRDAHFRHLLALSKQVPLYRATRPSDQRGASPDAFAERILAHLRAS